MGLGGAANPSATPEALAFLVSGEERPKLNGKEIELGEIMGRTGVLKGSTLEVCVLPSASVQRLTDLLLTLHMALQGQTVLLEKR